MVLSRSTMVRLSSSALLRHHTPSSATAPLHSSTAATPLLPRTAAARTLLLQLCGSKTNTANPKPYRSKLEPRQAIAPMQIMLLQCLFPSGLFFVILQSMLQSPATPPPFLAPPSPPLFVSYPTITPSAITPTPPLLPHHNSFYYRLHSSSPTPSQLLLLSPPSPKNFLSWLNIHLP